MVLDIGSEGDPIVPWAIEVGPCSSAPARRHDQPPRARLPHVPRNIRRLLHVFRSQVADCVCARSVLAEFPDWHNAVWEWSRLLRPGGTLILILPDCRRCHGVDPHDGRAFTVEQVKSINGRYGLEPVDLREPDADDPEDRCFVGVWRAEKERAETRAENASPDAVVRSSGWD